MHGSADTLVPVNSMEKLYTACPSYKKLHIFPNVQHAVAIAADPNEYYNVLKQFLINIGIMK
ncbi:alpha/beta hydrolase [Pectinatus frisingensis]|uniref:alpha/beta hydrolase n=1 Tax=Pectinatus frisingensis TaxID=865 RepID=UPI0018C683E1|nr:alpha/beta hydrolase [Pectinatus frisingensis]